MQNAKLVSYLHYHLIVFIWGFTAVLGALISIEAIPLVWYRMGIASILIFLYIKWKKIGLGVNRKTFVGFAIAGIVIALHWITFFGAIKAANVSVTLAVMSTGAFFTSLLEPLVYKRKMIWYELFFGVVVIIALYVIFDVETSYHLGIGLALISALLSVVFTLINGKFAHKHNPTKISFYELLIGTLFIMVFYAFAKAYTTLSNTEIFAFPVDLSSIFNITKTDIVYLFILASVCTAYAFIASVKVMKHLSPYTLMLTINLEPVYGIILAFFILGDTEKMSPTFYYGAIVILIVVILNGVFKNRKTFRRQIKKNR